MRFLTNPTTDLTYNDVFLVPSMSRVTSRFDADLSPQDAAARHLAPGTVVHLAVAPEDVTTYLA